MSEQRVNLINTSYLLLTAARKLLGETTEVSKDE